jgi:transcription antitermination factor NusA-like protein
MLKTNFIDGAGSNQFNARLAMPASSTLNEQNSASENVEKQILALEGVDTVGVELAGRDVERESKYEEYAGKEGEIVTGIIQQTDQRYTLLDLGRVEALLPQAEQVQNERYEHGSRLKAYIVEVRRTAKGPQIVVSRTHPGLIRRLFELEVPEIADGIVEIKACAREPGHRTKIAVWSNDSNVDPVGACVGARGARVRMVVNELRGEKIDIVPFSEDLADFVAKALSPAKVFSSVRRSRASSGAPPPKTSTTTCPRPDRATRKWPGKSTPCASHPAASAACSQRMPSATGRPRRRSITLSRLALDRSS